MHFFRAILLALWIIGPLTTAVFVHGPLSDHAVLQQGQPIPVWGTADPGETIAVRCAGQFKTAITNAQGRWLVRLDPLKADGNPVDLTVSGSITYWFRDLLVGEVWLCSGQSNMAMPMAAALDAQQEIASAKFPQIRLFTVTKNLADKPLTTCGGEWKVCSPSEVTNFSAVAYFFGRYLHQHLHVPIGLINSSWSGSSAEAWTSREALVGDADCTVVFDWWERDVKRRQEFQIASLKKIDKWEWDSVVAKNSNKAAPMKPIISDYVFPLHLKLTVLRNAMMTPLMPYGIRGVIWYQGEANASMPDLYRKLLPLMIRDWRQAWGQGDFPFYLVQLANLEGRGWPELREAQWLTTERVANTGLAVAIDIGEANNVHPRNKQKSVGVWRSTHSPRPTAS